MTTKKSRQRMTVLIPRQGAEALHDDLTDRVGPARGSRVRYLATLGLACERVGAHLSGQTTTGALVFPRGPLEPPIASGPPESHSDSGPKAMTEDDAAKRDLSRHLLGIDDDD